MDGMRFSSKQPNRPGFSILFQGLAHRAVSEAIKERQALVIRTCSLDRPGRAGQLGPGQRHLKITRLRHVAS